MGISIMAKSLMIIGRARGWSKAPHEGEAWGIRGLIGKRPMSRIFKMHETLTESQERLKKKAEDMGILFYTCKNYPLKKMIRHFKTDYFSNTVGYMIALALYEGYNKIDIYGINHAKGKEYIREKPGVDYWCGRAEGMGVDLTVHGQGKVLKTYNNRIYGYGKKQGTWNGQSFTTPTAS
jgi:hypothetical protein